jgi:hypothetical protein
MESTNLIKTLESMSNVISELSASVEMLTMDVKLKSATIGEQKTRISHLENEVKSEQNLNKRKDLIKLLPESHKIDWFMSKFDNEYDKVEIIMDMFGVSQSIAENYVNENWGDEDTDE